MVIMNTRMRPAARDQALDAVRHFHAERGRLPRQQEWEHATPDRPCARTIERRWGWRRLLAEVIGVEPDGLELWEGMTDDRAGRMLTGLVEARKELGRWPIAEEWEQSGRSRRGGRSSGTSGVGRRRVGRLRGCGAVTQHAVSRLDRKQRPSAPSKQHASS